MYPDPSCPTHFKESTSLLGADQAASLRSWILIWGVLFTQVAWIMGLGVDFADFG